MNEPKLYEGVNQHWGAKSNYTSKHHSRAKGGKKKFGLHQKPWEDCYPWQDTTGFDKERNEWLCINEFKYEDEPIVTVEES